MPADAPRPLHRSMPLVGRGLVMLVLGGVAVRWPESTIVPALLAGTAVLAASGVYEVTVALARRHRSPRWPVWLFDGLACVAFALVTLGFPALTMETAMRLIAAWFILYAAFCASLSVLLWPRRSAGVSLAIWSAMNLALGILALVMFKPGFTLVLYAGAAYAATFGAAQLIAGVWLRENSNIAPLPAG